jgi:hypothetical protein
MIIRTLNFPQKKKKSLSNEPLYKVYTSEAQSIEGRTINLKATWEAGIPVIAIAGCG